MGRGTHAAPGTLGRLAPRPRCPVAGVKCPVCLLAQEGCPLASVGEICSGSMQPQAALWGDASTAQGSLLVHRGAALCRCAGLCVAFPRTAWAGCAQEQVLLDRLASPTAVPETSLPHGRGWGKVPRRAGLGWSEVPCHREPATGCRPRHSPTLPSCPLAVGHLHSSAGRALLCALTCFSSACCMMQGQQTFPSQAFPRRLPLAGISLI